MDKNVNTFDVIMENCPFLKQIILDKINEEVQPLKKQVNALTKAFYSTDMLPAKEENK